MEIKISIPCAHCGENIISTVFCVDGILPLMAFEQESFYCDNCDHTTVTGDFDTFDSEDV